MLPIKISCAPNAFIKIDLGFKAQEFARLDNRWHAEFNIHIVFACKSNWRTGLEHAHDCARQAIDCCHSSLVTNVERLPDSFRVRHRQQHTILRITAIGDHKAEKKPAAAKAEAATKPVPSKAEGPAKTPKPSESTAPPQVEERETPNPAPADQTKADPDKAPKAKKAAPAKAAAKPSKPAKAASTKNAAPAKGAAKKPAKPKK